MKSFVHFYCFFFLLMIALVMSCTAILTMSPPEATLANKNGPNNTREILIDFYKSTGGASMQATTKTSFLPLFLYYIKLDS
jgi:hypothetical protein